MMKQSLLFGNGLNLLSENSVSWENILKNINNDDNNNTISIPYTMQYEKEFLNNCNGSTLINSEETYIKQIIAEKLKKQGTNNIYELVVNLGFDNYMTTNYDYTLNKSFKDKGYVYDVEKSDNYEKIYSLRRHSTYRKNDKYSKLWNIHGELNNVNSIMLGLDQYCGSIGKISSYVKGSYIYKKEKVIELKSKLLENRFDNISWIELFFNTDVYIVGFGLDYSEIDLWWILNKRGRLVKSKSKEIRNKINYYIDEISDSKQILLESMGVKVIKMNLENDDYKDYYKRIFDHIKNGPNV